MPYIGNVPAESYSQVSYQDLTGGSGTSFTLDYPAGSAGEIEVFVNNVRQEPTVAYTVSGTSLTMTGSITATDDFYVVFQGKAQQTIGIPEKQTNGDYNFDSNTLFIDSSTTSVGIGTSSPSDLLELSGDTAQPAIRLTDADVSGLYHRIFTPTNTGLSISADTGNVAADSFLRFDVDGSERARIDSSGNVGIGTSSPTYKLHVDADTNSVFRVGTTGGGALNVTVDDYTAAAPTWRIQSGASEPISFAISATEAIRIDSSGNFLVGKTVTDSSVSGVAMYSSGQIVATQSGAAAVAMRRNASDGSIALFQRSATNVGTLGYISTGFYIDGETNHSGWRFGNGGIIPFRNGADSDNITDLGSLSSRMDDIFATNGTIQTSDQNEKQQIASLTDAEITAAKAISKLFKTFKWNSAVEAKGDAARTHSGVIAQDVAQAMTDAGLDAGNYAFFISSTWWEADETYTDDDGVEQTRTNTYATLEEAPASATERTRLGIRYPELLAFIGAATEQRLTSIEARLDALETA